MTTKPQDDGKDGAPSNDEADDAETEFDKAFDEFSAGGDDDDPEGEPEGESEPEEPSEDTEGEPSEPAAAASSKDDDGGEGETKASQGTPSTDGDDDGALWEGATEAQRVAFERQRKALEAATRENQSHRGRQAYLSDRERQLAEKEKLEKPPTTVDGKALAEQIFNSDKWKAAKDDSLLADVIAPLEEVVKTVVEAQASALKDVTDKVGAITANEESRVAKTNQDMVEKAHPDWLDTCRSPDFRGWLADKAPGWARETVFKTNARFIQDPQSAIDVIDRFNRDTGRPTQAEPPSPKGDGKPSNTAQRRAQQLRSGQAVGNRTVGKSSGAPDEFDAAFDHYAKQKQRRAATGA